MSHNHERRLKLLEKKLLPIKVVMVWKNLGETKEQAIARHFNGEKPGGVSVVTVGWVG